MRSRTNNSLLALALAATMSIALLGAPALAQKGNSSPKTDSRILYHNGPIMAGTSAVYLIWYGGWPIGRAHQDTESGQYRLR